MIVCDDCWELDLLIVFFFILVVRNDQAMDLKQ